MADNIALAILGVSLLLWLVFFGDRTPEEKRRRELIKKLYEKGLDNGRDKF